MTDPSRPMHADFSALSASWELAMRADGYADNTLKSYLRALDTFAAWLHDQNPAVSPVDVSRNPRARTSREGNAQQRPALPIWPGGTLWPVTPVSSLTAAHRCSTMEDDPSNLGQERSGG